ncbi:MAG: hypothetical protein KIT33_15315 [Candidatus Kapabacteria bacterium]|nr:hypothetical protein [Ignavibacteriota bacterium]MCW5886338.1 hypothetical protein [Candidatus Kapabacteria bacterium]
MIKMYAGELNISIMQEIKINHSDRIVRFKKFVEKSRNIIFQSGEIYNYFQIIDYSLLHNFDLKSGLRRLNNKCVYYYDYIEMNGLLFTFHRCNLANYHLFYKLTNNNQENLFGE